MSHALHFLILTVAGWLQRRLEAQVDYLIAENAVYKKRLGRAGLRLTDGQRRQLAIKAKAVGRKDLARIATIATPDTILRWYRRLVARKYDGSAQRGPGRPRTREDVTELIVRMATENPRWGYTRIQGALKYLDLLVGRSTIARVLAGHGLLPAPERSKRTSWRVFLRAHWGALAATDFFSVEVLTLHGLVRYFVLFVIDLKTRRVEIAGIVHQPHEAWMRQIARNLTDVVDGFLRGKWKLIHDRDPLCTAISGLAGCSTTTTERPRDARRSSGTRRGQRESLRRYLSLRSARLGGVARTAARIAVKSPLATAAAAFTLRPWIDRQGKGRLSIDASHLSLDQQVTYLGPTWLDAARPSGSSELACDITRRQEEREAYLRERRLWGLDLRSLERCRLSEHYARRLGLKRAKRLDNFVGGAVAIHEAPSGRSDVVIANATEVALMRATARARELVGGKVRLTPVRDTADQARGATTRSRLHVEPVERER